MKSPAQQKRIDWQKRKEHARRRQTQRINKSRVAYHAALADPLPLPDAGTKS